MQRDENLELLLSTHLIETYEVEYVLAERRLDDRRKASPHAPLPPGLREDRRRSDRRCEEDQ